jgi:hypothetical protein
MTSSPPTLPLGQGFGPVFGWGLRLTLRGRRFVVIAAASVFLGAILGFEGVRNRWYPDHALDLWTVLEEQVLRFVAPLVALLLVSQAYAREVQDRTLVYHLVRPVSRTTVYFARFLAGLVAAGVAAVLLVGTLLATSGVSLPVETWLLTLAATLVGVVAVGAVYYALAAVFRHGILIGLVYTFVVETMFAGARGSMQRLAVMFHVRSLHHRWTDDAFAALAKHPERIRGLPETQRGFVLPTAPRIAWDEPGSAALVLLVVAVVALVVGAVVVARRDYALKD